MTEFTDILAINIANSANLIGLQKRGHAVRRLHRKICGTIVKCHNKLLKYNTKLGDLAHKSGRKLIPINPVKQENYHKSPLQSEYWNARDPLIGTQCPDFADFSIHVIDNVDPGEDCVDQRPLHHTATELGFTNENSILVEPILENSTKIKKLQRRKTQRQKRKLKRQNRRKR